MKKPKYNIGDAVKWQKEIGKVVGVFLYTNSHEYEYRVTKLRTTKDDYPYYDIAESLLEDSGLVATDPTPPSEVEETKEIEKLSVEEKTIDGITFTQGTSERMKINEIIDWIQAENARRREGK